MDTIMLIFLAVVIIYRICITAKKISLIVKTPGFIKGVVMLLIYGVTIVNFMLFLLALTALVNEPGYTTVEVVSFILWLASLAMAFLLLYFLAKEYEELRLPLMLIILILSLGLVLFKAYNIASNVDSIGNIEPNGANNYNDNINGEKEYVAPHDVQGHYRNGSWVEGYHRDGDGDPTTRLTEENGGGYLRSK